jgi:hypothetical protein
VKSLKFLLKVFSFLIFYVFTLDISVASVSDSVKLNYDSAIISLKEKLNDDFNYVVYKCFLVVSNLEQNMTSEIVERTMKTVYKSFYNDFFESEPDELITVFLFKDDQSYRYWADKLFSDKDVSKFGYYKTSLRTMLMNVGTGLGTLVHEMTHSLVRYDFPDIPAWFNEGLGSLYEQCGIENGNLKGYVNWRLTELKDAIQNNNYLPLKRLVKLDDDMFYEQRSSFNYAQARYLCYYLQERNLLKLFYKSFRDNYEYDKTGESTLVKITGSTIEELDKKFVSFVSQLK